MNKPWGRRDIGAFGAGLEPWPADALSDPIGEIWFEPEASDVLVKYLFTSERLSIQVHPDDRQARALHGVRGKEECWLILDAEDGAHYGIGLTREVSPAALKQAALDGSIVDLIDWREARIGDFIYNIAGTVHALGPGLTVLEVQQNCDITLRLFDYFSGRGLHVDQAVNISRLGPHWNARDAHIDFSRTQILVDGPKFGLAFCRGAPPSPPAHARDFQLVTWKDAVKAGGDLIPPASSVKLASPEDIEETGDARYFLVWSSPLAH